MFGFSLFFYGESSFLLGDALNFFEMCSIIRGMVLSRLYARAFTLVELLFVVFLLGVLLFLLFPHVQSMLDQSGYMDCESRLEMIRRAKSAYVVDHLGAGSPTNAKDQAVFRVYFMGPFSFICPRDGVSAYSSVYDVYSLASCPHCATNVPMGVKTRVYQP